MAALTVLAAPALLAEFATLRGCTSSVDRAGVNGKVTELIRLSKVEYDDNKNQICPHLAEGPAQSRAWPFFDRHGGGVLLLMKKNSEYSQKLRDPRWQKKRLEVMDKANWKCERCKASDKELQVHHGMYEYGLEPWEYDHHVLWCLCRDCHEEVTETKRRISVWIGATSPSDYAFISLVLQAVAISRKKNSMLVPVTDEHESKIASLQCHTYKLFCREYVDGLSTIFGTEKPK